MNAAAQAGLAAEYADLTRLSMAGNLKEYELETASGKRIKGKDLLYGNLPAGYTEQPVEHVAYTSCHDGEILFDQVHQCHASRPVLEACCAGHADTCVFGRCTYALMVWCKHLLDSISVCLILIQHILKVLQRCRARCAESSCHVLHISI